MKGIGGGMRTGEERGRERMNGDERRGGERELINPQ